jgi:hypothetical protein
LRRSSTAAAGTCSGKSSNIASCKLSGLSTPCRISGCLQERLQQGTHTCSGNSST